MTWSFLPFGKGFQKWKSDRNALDKAILGLGQALFEIEQVQRADPADSAATLNETTDRFRRYKADLEYRRTVAPIKMTGLLEMAADVDQVGKLLKTLAPAGLFGDDGLWGCDLVSVGLKVMVEFDAKD